MNQIINNLCQTTDFSNDSLLGSPIEIPDETFKLTIDKLKLTEQTFPQDGNSLPELNISDMKTDFIDAFEFKDQLTNSTVNLENDEFTLIDVKLDDSFDIDEESILLDSPEVEAVPIFNSNEIILRNLNESNEGNQNIAESNHLVLSMNQLNGHYSQQDENNKLQTLINPVNEEVVDKSIDIEKDIARENDKTFLEDKANLINMKRIENKEGNDQSFENLDFSEKHEHLMAKDGVQDKNDINLANKEGALNGSYQISEIRIKNLNDELNFKMAYNQNNLIAGKNFEKDLSNKIQIMIKSNESTAKVNIDPPELGHIEIKIVQNADQTHVLFHTAHELTKDLIESQIHKLRSEMEQQGINLGDVSVSHGDRGDHQNNGAHLTKNAYQSAIHQSSHQIEPGIQLELPLSNNLLDLFV